MSFSWEDIPSISFARGGVGDQVMHTVGDSIDLISPKQLEKIGALIEVFMQRTVTDGYIFPFPREVPKDLIKKDVFAMKRIKDTAKFLGYDLDDLKD
jgi:hypothetical protein